MRIATTNARRKKYTTNHIIVLVGALYLAYGAYTIGNAVLPDFFTGPRMFGRPT